MVYSLMLLLMIASISRVLSSPTSRCSCVSSITCTTVPYGRLALDIALLGVHAPCPLPGQVLCCDRSGLEDLYGDSEPRQQILEKAHPVDNGHVTVTQVPEGSIFIGDKNLLEIDEDGIEIELINDNDAIKRPESIGNNKLKVKESVIGGDEDELTSRCGCIPAGICPQEYKYAGNDQCDKTARLELCCINVLDDEEPQHEVEIEDFDHSEEPQHEAQADGTVPAEEYRVASVEAEATFPNIKFPLGEKSSGVDLNETQQSFNTPPKVSLVPCTITCTGIPYSPLDIQHRELYGLLAECSSGMI